MTVDEMMERLGVTTTAEVARILGIPYRTIQNWRLGLRTQPDWVARLIEHEVERIVEEQKKRRV